MAGASSPNADAEETDALLAHNNNDTQPKYSKLWHHLNEEIDPRHCDLIMLYCYLITGFLDSSSVLIWGSFVSMQTGNTVYLGLGLAGVDSSGDRAIKSGASIASFCIGSMFFGAFYRLFHPGLRRWVLCVSFTIQMLLMVCAAIIVSIERTDPSRELELNWRVIVPVIFVGFQSSGQAVTSRVVELGSLSSVVLTNTYCDLFSHVNIFLSPGDLFNSVSQRRRLFAVVLLLLGTVLGGIWARSSVGMMGSLWTAVVLKAFIIVAWLFWRAGKRGQAEV